MNNLPAYLALEPGARTAGELMALIIGVNAGPIITPWGSLATLLWADQLRRQAFGCRGGALRSGGSVSRRLGYPAP